MTPSHRNIAIAAATALRVFDRKQGDEVRRLIDVADQTAVSEIAPKVAARRTDEITSRRVSAGRLVPSSDDYAELLAHAHQVEQERDTAVAHANGLTDYIRRMEASDKALRSAIEEAKVAATPNGNEAVPPPARLKGDALYASHGYALATRVLQSDLYSKLDDRERAECDALVNGTPASSIVPNLPNDECRQCGCWSRSSGCCKTQEPVAWRVRASHGNVFWKTKVSDICEPLYAAPVSATLLKDSGPLPWVGSTAT